MKKPDEEATRLRVIFGNCLNIRWGDKDNTKDWDGNSDEFEEGETFDLEKSTKDKGKDSRSWADDCNAGDSTVL